MFRLPGMILVLLTVVAAVRPVALRAQEELTLPTLDDMERPLSFEELMEAERFDWVVLKESSRVLVVEALLPRPNTFERLTEERKKLESIRRRTQDESRRLSEVKLLKISLLGDPDEYQLKMEDVENIINFEVFMLERIDLLLDADETTKAFDLLQRLDAYVPDWEEAVPRFNRLLYLEATRHARDGSPVAAMALLEQLHDRAPEFSGLSDAMGGLLSPLISQAIDNGEYREARWLLRRLSRRFPDYPMVGQVTQRLRSLAAAEVSRAVELSRNGSRREASDVARVAGHIWPLTGRIRSERSEVMALHQVVRVAVPTLDDKSSFPVPLRPELRHRELVSVPLFEADSVNEITHYRSAFIEEWEPQDLGRVVTFSLRTNQPYWQPQPLLSAGQVADALAVRLNPDSDNFDPRLASFVAGYSVRSPSSIEIRFSRVPLNLAAMFRFPVHLRDMESGGEVAALAGRFDLVEATDDQRLYARHSPEPEGLLPDQYHVAEILEQKYESRHLEIQAFRRGEVDVLPYLRPWEADAIRDSELGSVLQFAAPDNHVIVFNPHREAVQNPQLRRALSLAIPREIILKRIILQDEAMKYGRVSSAAWPQASYASSPLVEDPKFDLRLAFALKFAAEEQLKIPVKQQLVAEARAAAREAGEDWVESVWRAQNAEMLREATAEIKLPPLTMLCDPDPVMQEAAEKMAEFWGRLGLDVQLVYPDSADEPSTDWDMMYRRVRMEEPLLDLWPVLLTDHSLDVSLLAGYPDWMRQDLTGLDYAGSFRVARNRLFRIERNIAAQAFLIPLWEVEQFIAFRHGISGFRERPLSVYDDVQRWVVKP